MKYQPICRTALLTLFIFFIPQGLSAWMTQYGTTSSEDYRIKQKTGGSQDYKLSFPGNYELLLRPAGSYEVNVWGVTASLLYLKFLENYQSLSQTTLPPYTFITAFLGTLAGGISFLNHLSQGSGEQLTLNDFNSLMVTGLSYNQEMNVEIGLSDDKQIKAIKIVSHIEKRYDSGAPKQLLVTIVFSSDGREIKLEFEIFVPEFLELFEVSLADNPGNSINSDKNDEDPDAGCCGSGLTGCVSTFASYVISYCCRSQSSETQSISTSKGSGYGTLQLMPQINFNNSLKMAIGAKVLLLVPAPSVISH